MSRLIMSSTLYLGKIGYTDSTINLMTTALSSLSQCSLKSWDYTWSASKAYDGTITPYASFSTAFAASGGSDDHNGRGCEITFNSSKFVNIFKVYGHLWKLGKFKVEYDDNGWQLYGEYTNPTINEGVAVITLNNTAISSSNWRIYCSETTTTSANCYLSELEVYDKILSKL